MALAIIHVILGSIDDSSLSLSIFFSRALLMSNDVSLSIAVYSRSASFNNSPYLHVLYNKGPLELGL